MEDSAFVFLRDIFIYVGFSSFMISFGCGDF